MLDALSGLEAPRFWTLSDDVDDVPCRIVLELETGWDRQLRKVREFKAPRCRLPALPSSRLREDAQLRPLPPPLRPILLRRRARRLREQSRQ